MTTFESSTGIPLDAANLMSALLEGILYGFSVLMFMGTMWTFTHKRRIRDVNRPMIVVATLLFLLSTTHMVVGIIHVENGLVKYRDTFPGWPGGNAIVVLETLLGDGVVIYRCYIVWQSVWVIILPCILWCGVAVFGVCMVYSMSQPQTNNSVNFFLNAIPQWITAFLAFTIATNLLSSGLLAYRIWMIERKVSAIRTTKGKLPIWRVLVDAAILTSVATCSSLISFLCSSNGMYIMADLVIPVIPITFYMVFIRIATSQNNQDYISTVRGGTNETERRNLQQYPMQPLHSIFRQNSAISILTNGPKVHPLL
ncbi:hypothetical protein EDB19DRAFT_1898939 [Suillus lakei]|nr:hypothetical protein EDB19DRAFT_1898939 [Suillus lakei]